MSANHLWTSWVDSSPPIPLDLSKSSRSAFESKLFSFCICIPVMANSYAYRWGEANIAKGQAGVKPEDVYGTRI